MTEPTIEELRKCLDWQPDNPETGQIWKFVEAMRKLGFHQFQIHWNRLLKSGGYVGYFGKSENELGNGYDLNPCIAILMAGHAALKGEK